VSAPHPDAEARRRIREDLDATLFVEAAAGTGKTTALVARIVAMLRAGKAALESMVAVTFTEKAAGEMKLRLRAEIERALGETAPGSPERQRFERALEQLELARIGTFHGFCADLLHERPVEAGVDPLFAVANEDEQRRLQERAFERWFSGVQERPPEGVRRILRRRPRGFGAEGPRADLAGALAELVEHRDFEAPWQRVPFAREAAIDAALAQLFELAELAPRAAERDDWLAKSLAEIARFAGEIRLREAVAERDHDGLEAELRALSRQRFWNWKGRRVRLFAPGLPRDEVLARRDAAKQALLRLREDCDADLAACLREELRGAVAGYEEEKRRAGCLDFVDLLLRTRDLLLRERDVRRELMQRTSHFFVDEFQDTDPLQVEILLLLCADDPEERDWRRALPSAGKLFAVGDPKQSIYRFRRADVAIYEEVKARLVAAGPERGVSLLHLSTSFRAPPSLQAAVNAAFEPLMQGAPDGSQPAYVPLEPARDEVTGRPTLVALPVPSPYSHYGRITNWSIDASLPDAVGAFVAWLIRDSGWTVRVPGEDGALRDEPIRPRDVCLLFRRMKTFREDVTRGYVRALEARRIAHVLIGGRSFHDREEVLALRNALAAIEWPDDELRVFASLRGPLFAHGDDALLAFRRRQGSLHPLRRHDDAALDDVTRPVAASLALLASLHRARNRRPIADTLRRLLEALRAHAGIAIWPTGEQALANCLRLVDLARRFEQRGAPSFRAFVERLEADAERGESQDAPVVEEGTEGVRIMTAHKAKGLEFPVVILCDPTCKATRDTPSRHVDPEAGLWAEPLAGCAPRELLVHREVELARDVAEAQRLAYVAATRARDLLVVPVVADAEPEDGWLAALHPIVYPSQVSSGEREPAPGCPAFGAEAVRMLPGRPRARVGYPARESVRPGRLRPRAGSHTVVWWDPNLLELDVEQRVGLRQQRLLEADREGARATEGAREHEAWQAARAARLLAGEQPSQRVATVTALAAEGGAAPAAAVGVETLARAAGPRPHGARFGTLVHALLAAADLGADADALRELAALQGRLVDASAEEVAAAADAALRALAHPVVRRAARAAALRRETPVLLRQPDGRLAEGVVDLAFREETPGGARWTVVDWKTDLELGDRRATYERQVGLYAEAVARATGEPAEGLLLVV
jgi:ATP-dependent exoDNAse (exonuclease V) beta subunit